MEVDERMQPQLVLIFLTMQMQTILSLIISFITIVSFVLSSLFASFYVSQDNFHLWFYSNNYFLSFVGYGNLF